MFFAQNSNKFLEAIIGIGIFLQKRSIRTALYDDLEVNAKKLEEAALKAGGKEFFSFYNMNLGIYFFN